MTDFFGGGGSTTTTNKVDLWTPSQWALYNSLIASAQQPAEQYGGELYAGENPYESAFLAAAGQPSAGFKSSDARNAALAAILGGSQDYMAQVNAYLDQGLPQNMTDPLQQGARVSILTGADYPEVREKYYQQAFYDPAMSEYTNKILPQTMEAASGAGFHSSDTLQQMGQAGKDVETNLAAKRAELLYTDTQAAANRMLTLLQGEETIGANIATSRGSAATAAQGWKAGAVTAEGQLGLGIAQLEEAMQGRMTGELGAAGVMARNIDESKIAGELQGWLAGQSAVNAKAQLGLGLLTMQPYAYQQQTDTEGPGGGQGLWTGIGVGIGAAAAAAAL